MRMSLLDVRMKTNSWRNLLGIILLSITVLLETNGLPLTNTQQDGPFGQTNSSPGKTDPSFEASFPSYSKQFGQETRQPIVTNEIPYVYGDVFKSNDFHPQDVGGNNIQNNLHDVNLGAEYNAGISDYRYTTNQVDGSDLRSQRNKHFEDFEIHDDLSSRRSSKKRRDIRTDQYRYDELFGNDFDDTYTGTEDRIYYYYYDPAVEMRFGLGSRNLRFDNNNKEDNNNDIINDNIVSHDGFNMREKSKLKSKTGKGRPREREIKRENGDFSKTLKEDSIKRRIDQDEFENKNIRASVPQSKISEDKEIRPNYDSSETIKKTIKEIDSVSIETTTTTTIKPATETSSESSDSPTTKLVKTTRETTEDGQNKKTTTMNIHSEHNSTESKTSAKTTATATTTTTTTTTTSDNTKSGNETTETTKASKTFDATTEKLKTLSENTTKETSQPTETSEKVETVEDIKSTLGTTAATSTTGSTSTEFTSTDYSTTSDKNLYMDVKNQIGDYLGIKPDITPYRNSAYDEAHNTTSTHGHAVNKASNVSHENEIDVDSIASTEDSFVKDTDEKLLESEQAEKESNIDSEFNKTTEKLKNVSNDQTTMANMTQDFDGLDSSVKDSGNEVSGNDVSIKGEHEKHIVEVNVETGLTQKTNVTETTDVNKEEVDVEKINAEPQNLHGKRKQSDVPGLVKKELLHNITSNSIDDLVLSHESAHNITDNNAPLSIQSNHKTSEENQNSSIIHEKDADTKQQSIISVINVDQRSKINGKNETAKNNTNIKENVTISIESEKQLMENNADSAGETLNKHNDEIENKQSSFRVDVNETENLKIHSDENLVLSEMNKQENKVKKLTAPATLSNGGNKSVSVNETKANIASDEENVSKDGSNLQTPNNTVIKTEIKDIKAMDASETDEEELKVKENENVITIQEQRVNSTIDLLPVDKSTSNVNVLNGMTQMSEIRKTSNVEEGTKNLSSTTLDVKETAPSNPLEINDNSEKQIQIQAKQKENSNQNSSNVTKLEDSLESHDNILGDSQNVSLNTTASSNKIPANNDSKAAPVLILSEEVSQNNIKTTEIPVSLEDNSENDSNKDSNNTPATDKSIDKIITDKPLESESTSEDSTTVTIPTLEANSNDSNKKIEPETDINVHDQDSVNISPDQNVIDTNTTQLVANNTPQQEVNSSVEMTTEISGQLDKKSSSLNQNRTDDDSSKKTIINLEKSNISISLSNNTLNISVEANDVQSKMIVNHTDEKTQIKHNKTSDPEKSDTNNKGLSGSIQPQNVTATRRPKSRHPIPIRKRPIPLSKQDGDSIISESRIQTKFNQPIRPHRPPTPPRQSVHKLTLADFPSLLLRRQEINRNKVVISADTNGGKMAISSTPDSTATEDDAFDDINIPKTSAYMVQDFSLRKPEDWQLKSREVPQRQESVESSDSYREDVTTKGDCNETTCKETHSKRPNYSAPRISTSTKAQAAVSAVLTSHFGPTKQEIIPFNLELLDLADNYDNTTGMFIATIPGTYVISVYLMSHPGAKVNARVYVNDRPVAALWADDSKHAGFYPSSSIQTVAQLGFGDQVYVMLVDGGYGDSWVHANYNVFTVFLLYEETF